MSDETINFTELIRLYNGVGTVGACQTFHKNSHVSTDGEGVYHWKCDDCGRMAFGDYKAAVALRWIDVDSTSVSSDQAHD